MVLAKITKRRRGQPDWLKNDVHPIFDLTEDGDEPESVSASDLNSVEDGKRSPERTKESSFFDREIEFGDQEEDNLQYSNPSKDSSIAEDLRVDVQSATNTEVENHKKGDASEIVLCVESIQPSTMIKDLYMKFSAQAVEVGGGNKEGMIHKWPLENIVRIGIYYVSKEEEDSRACIAVTVSVPLYSLAGSSREISEYLLELLNFRDSMVGISKLSPVFVNKIKELNKEDVEETARTIKMQNLQASNSLFASSSEELDMPGDAFKVLVYPQGDPDAVTITRKDMKILKPSEFLNDTIIDFYIKYLQQTIVSSEKLKTLHFFNSFFFSKLAEVDGAAAFERVKKWTRKVNVFEKDFVFIPVNQRYHWSLIIICHPGHLWEVPTAFSGSSDGDACILHLDSMEGCHRGLDAHIRNYLFQEWIERNKDPEEMLYAEEFFSGMPYRYSKVPQQGNNCDCGLFLLHYVELFLKTAPSVYRTKRQRSPLTEFLRRNWFNPSEASAKRLVIQRLILELSKGRSLESFREFTDIKEGSVFPADEQLSRASPMSLCDDKLVSAQSIDALGSVLSSPSYQGKEPLIENCPYARSEAMEPQVDLCGFLITERQDERVKLRHVNSSTGCDHVTRDMHHIGSDQTNVSCKCGANQSSAHFPVVNDGFKSGPLVLPDDETWDHEQCPIPCISLQVKPLQVPALLDEDIQVYSQPPVAVDLGVKAASETSDELSSSYCDGDDRRSEEERRLLDFDRILSPEQVNNCVATGSNDEMYESSSFGVQHRCSTSHLQHEVVSLVVGTLEHAGFAPVRSPVSLDAHQDDFFKKEGRIVESRRKPRRYRNNTSPFGKCSELNTCRQRKQLEDSDRTREDSCRPYGSSVDGGEVQEIEEISSDDSSDSLRMRSLKRTAKPSSVVIEQRVTRSKVQSSHGLPLSAEKKVRESALDALLRRQAESRKR